MDVSRCSIAVLLFLYFGVYVSMQQVTVSLSGDKARTEEGDAFQLECDVSGIVESDVVTISKERASGYVDIIASSQGQPPGNPSHLESTWFASGEPTSGGLLQLNINGAMRSDTGDYTCTAIRGSTVLGEDTLHLDLLYAPSSPPICNYDPRAPSSDSNYHTVTLVCFVLDQGNPIVNITWIRDDGGYIPDTSTTNLSPSGIPYGEVTITMSLDDNGKRFICNTKSIEFPEFHQICTLPVYVIPHPTKLPTTTPIRQTTQPTVTHVASVSPPTESRMTSRASCYKQQTVTALSVTLVTIVVGLVGVTVFLGFKVHNLRQSFICADGPPNPRVDLEVMNSENGRPYEVQPSPTQVKQYSELQKDGMSNLAYENLKQKEYETVGPV